MRFCGGGAVFSVTRRGRRIGHVVASGDRFTAWRGDRRLGVFNNMMTAARAV
jgi:hypothetical protein